MLTMQSNREPEMVLNLIMLLTGNAAIFYVPFE